MSPIPPAVTLTEPTDESITLTVYEPSGEWMARPLQAGRVNTRIVLTNRGALALAEQLQRFVELGKDFRLV